MKIYFIYAVVLSISLVSGMPATYSAPSPNPGPESSPAPEEEAQTNQINAHYKKAVGLMDFGRKSSIERRNDASWGEYSLARNLLSGISESDPGFRSNNLSLRIRVCEAAIKRLASALPEDERQMFGKGKETLDKVSGISEQNDKTLVIIEEIKDCLDLVEGRGAAVPGEALAAEPDKSDEDGDGLTNAEELGLGTSPYSSDTDSDGLSDFEEVDTYSTDPLKADSDNDGLSDSEEVDTYLTDPLNADSDNDGLSDGFEVKSFNSNPLNPDTDGDGLLDGEEKIHGTDPNNPDTDGDAGYTMPVFPWFSGGTDKEEVDNGWDPLTHIQEKEDEFY